MVLLLLSIGWCAIIGLLLARAIVQYSHYEVIGPVDEDVADSAPRVSVIIPARNEERGIERCVRSVLSQKYPRKNLEILVIDDESRDQTAAIVQRLAAQDPRLTLLHAHPLPAGWLGKPHACAQAAQQAKGEFLCFLDADTVAQPLLIATAVQTARTRQLDLLSLQPFQELISVAERLLLPAGFFLLAFTQDLRSTNDPASADASVNGQFLLIRRPSYESAGGHTGVRNQFAEDSALAGNLKSAGFRVMVLGTREMLSTRMYSDLRSLLEGTARQAATLLSGSLPLAIAAAAAALLAAFAVVLPLICAYKASHVPSEVALISLSLSLFGSLALMGTHIGAARYFRIPFYYGLLFPLSYLFGAGVLLYAIRAKAHRQTRWKGRIYRDGTEDVNSPTQAGVA